MQTDWAFSPKFKNMSTPQKHTDNAQQFVNQLSDHLFWDVDRQKLSWEEDTDFIVGRVLGYGITNDWRILLRALGIEKIAKAAKRLRYLDDVSLHFIAHVSDTPLNEFRCYTNKQYLNGHWSS